jgi:large subunit ribosomal protein L21
MKKTENKNNENVFILPLKKEAQTVLDRYAIIETGGKQYFALEGKTIMIEKLPQEPGEVIVFSSVLFKRENKEKCEVGNPYVTTPVTGVVIKHLRGDKIIVFKFKRRKKYRKKQGHRQSYTVVRITSI